MTLPQHAEYTSNIAIAGRLLALDGATAVDIGCGEGRFTRFLAKAGASVTGIDINQTALDTAEARAREEGLAIAWKKASAVSLPFESASLDIVVFSNSLHHVAPENMAQALEDAARVLKPGGILYIMEPIAEGAYFEATRMVNDERAVRAKALEAIEALPGRGFTLVESIIYRTRKDYDSFEAYRAEQSARGPKREALFREQGAAIRERFESHARKEDGRLCFDQFFRIHYFHKSG